MTSLALDQVRPWLDEPPTDWRVVPLGHLVDLMGGATPSKDEPAFWSGSIPWVSPKDMKRDVIDDSIDHVSEDALASSSLRLVPERAVLTVVRGMILAHTVPVAITSAPVTLNQDMKALLARRGVAPEFLAWALRAFQNALLALVEEAGHGTKKLRTDLFKKFLLLVPPEEEQRAIADFLDRKTAAIDALIEKKERLIALLEEKRQALITQAVTKGLDPVVPMKDSGIEWLGEIPAHWEVTRFKFLVLESVAGPYGASLTKAMYTPSGYRVYGQEQASTNNFAVGDYYISEEKFASMRRYETFPGDLLVCVMGYGNVGRVAVVPEGIERGIINPRLVRYRPDPDRAHAGFLQASMMSEAGQVPLREAAQGSTMPGLNMALLGDLEIALPPLQEQTTIYRFVQNEASSYDAVRAAITKQVGLLREYRQSVITAAVTGKLDVTSEEAA